MEYIEKTETENTRKPKKRVALIQCIDCLQNEQIIHFHPFQNEQFHGIIHQFTPSNIHEMARTVERLSLGQRPFIPPIFLVLFLLFLLRLLLEELQFEP